MASARKRKKLRNSLSTRENLQKKRQLMPLKMAREVPLIRDKMLLVRSKTRMRQVEELLLSRMDLLKKMISSRRKETLICLT